MSLKSLADVEAIELRLGFEKGSLQGADLARAQAALDDASALVRAEAGKPWLDEEGDVTAPAQVVTIVVKAALREFKNPDGFSSEQMGDYSYRTDQTGGVYLTEDERRIVRQAAGAGAYGAWTVRTRSHYDTTYNLPLPENYFMGNLD